MVADKFTGGETNNPEARDPHKEEFYVDEDTFFVGDVAQNDRFYNDHGRPMGNILDPRGNVARAESIANGMSILVTDKVQVPLEAPKNLHVDLKAEHQDTIYVPKIMGIEEVSQDVNLKVKVPTPHVVPSPVIVEVEVPILKFRNNYVCIPVRKRVIPRFVKSKHSYRVAVERQIPYLVIQDIIKPVPVDTTTSKGSVKYEPNTVAPKEISAADYHQLWQRANAELLDDRRALLRKAGMDPNLLTMRQLSKNAEPEQILGDDADKPWHPHHPIYLQNKWLMTKPQDMPALYETDFIEQQLQASQKLIMEQLAKEEGKSV